MSKDMKFPDANPDPLTGAPGAHPVGVGTGAAGGAAAGAAIGAAVGGPVGAMVGGTIGAVAGGLSGKGAAEVVNPTVEDAYWRTHYQPTEPGPDGEPYETYQPAYRYGWEGPSRFPGLSFEAAEPRLREGWEQMPDAKGMSWARARQSVRDAWRRVEQTFGGHPDLDRS